MNSLRHLPSPAKINLILRVLGRRPDGYHDISSVMQPISLYDRVSIAVDAGSEGAGVNVACDHPQVPAGPSNLAQMAAERFLGKTGIRSRVDIAIEKRIPVGAGLGGGSSNAATVLMGLNTLCGAPLDEGTLFDLAASVGSDVPFFMLKGPALAEGRGERLRRIALPAYDYVLINPGFQVPASWAYNNLDLTKCREDNKLSYSDERLGRADTGGIRGLLANDLEDAVSTGHPEIARLKAVLLDAGSIGALMSGSGPTVFGIFPDREGARRGYERLMSGMGRDKAASVFLAKGLT
jgi:4-diphosphocytidyl-2-C-methyl-D-erythritol kinase